MHPHSYFEPDPCGPISRDPYSARLRISFDESIDDDLPVDPFNLSKGVHSTAPVESFGGSRKCDIVPYGVDPRVPGSP
jgi:hypothetical protein